MKSQNLSPELITNYINSKFPETRERGNEMMFPCFNGCDDDDTESEKFHCSINLETGLWHCFKCEAKGNFATLQQQLDDQPALDVTERAKKTPVIPKKLMTLAEHCHKDLMKTENKKLLDYLLTERKISLFNVNSRLLGIGEFYGKQWLTIPIIESKDCKLIKLRRLPSETEGAKYMVYPEGAGSAVLGTIELKRSNSSSVLICGGEYDYIIAEQMKFGMPIITSTTGEGTFKDEWIDAYLDGRNKIYICFDNDEKGKNATKTLAEKITKRLQNVSVYKVPIPEELGDKADLTDANKADFTAKQLLSRAELVAGDNPAEASEFAEMSLDKLQSVLNLTIKYDDVNKVLVFLGMLSAYTEEDQLNIFLNAKSSSGKTYIASEVAKLFPKMDVRKYMRVTPTAFYYDDQAMDQNISGETVLDLSRKILLFMDQVDTKLQEMIRPLLSHDDKKTAFKLTNRSNSGKNSAVNGYILGYPATVFCSANMRMDEQEQTRAILLSPEITQEKINTAIDLYGEKASDIDEFNKKLCSDPDRKSLMRRIQFIRDLHISQIITKGLNVSEAFKSTSKHKFLPRHQRDLQHFYSLVKVCALLNAPTREIREHNLVATSVDVDAALVLWKFLGRSQEYGIPPQVLDFYEQEIVPTYQAKNASVKICIGITMDELTSYHFNQTNEMLNRDLIRKQYLPVLDGAGLIKYEKNPENRRQMLITPLIINDNSQRGKENE